MRDSKAEILSFWFSEISPRQWFQPSVSLDERIRNRFLVIYKMAREGICDAWKTEPEGCLALCLLFDQFPHHLFRGKRESLDMADRALSVAKYAVSKGFDQALPPLRRRFVYLPYEHSERLTDQDECVSLFAAMKDDDPQGYEYAVRHRTVIERYGRFPARNQLLGRAATPEEEAFLSENPRGF